MHNDVPAQLSRPRQIRNDVKQNDFNSPFWLFAAAPLSGLFAWDREGYA